MSTVVTLGSVILVLAFLAMALFSRWRLKTIGFVLAGVAVAFVGAVFWFSFALERALERRNGPLHVFELKGRAQFLEESVALEMARQTVFLDGFTNGVWSPARLGSSVAPDGTVDIYLMRSTQNPKRGFLQFTNAQSAEACVRLEIEGTNLVCQRVVGK